MKYCSKCKMNVRGNRANCPLCQSTLGGEGEADIFPQIPTIYRQHRMFFKILIFITVCIVVIACTVNLMFPEPGFWAFLVIVGAVCFWIMLAFVLRKRNNIPKKLTYQVFFIAVFSLIWDYITGWRGWSADYVLPAVFMLGMASLAIVSKVMKIPFADYITCLVADGIFGFTPVLFLLLGITNIVYPSYICVAFSIISLVSLLIFAGRNLLSEAQRKLHL